MTVYPWKWNLADLPEPAADAPTAFSCFSCGGGSTMGYKRAGFRVLGNVEIDPAMFAMYMRNHHPAHSYCMDIRQFNQMEGYPPELMDLDVLDGSPPCTTFSTAGLREESWGKAKQFREGQKFQTLDDLFMVFLDTVDRLRPRAVVAENVSGILKGNAKGYVKEVYDRLSGMGYATQIFRLNACDFDVPQGRERVFVIANRMGMPKLTIERSPAPLLKFGEVRSRAPGRKPKAGSTTEFLLSKRLPSDETIGAINMRLYGKLSGFTRYIFQDDRVASTLAANGGYVRGCDGTYLTDEDMINVSTFPQDYDFMGGPVHYAVGMSVPPSLMAHIAESIREQWVSRPGWRGQRWRRSTSPSGPCSAPSPGPSWPTSWRT